MNQRNDDQKPTYAEALVGHELKGWLVVRRLTNDEFSGGYNSVTYVATKDGETAFLKAFDVQDVLRRAQKDPNFDSALEINKITQKYMFERDLLNDCKRLNRIVNIIDSDTPFIEPSDLSSYLPFIVCELADCDIRQALGTIDRYDVSWRLTTLHHAAIGLSQLHTNSIAHNDFKQANILVVQNGRKIGDLGSGSRRGMPGPNDGGLFPGDIRYAPPEIIYDVVHPDWVRRHIPIDLFALGSVATYLFTGLSMYSLMMHTHLSEVHRTPLYGGTWSGTFEEVIPYLVNAYSECLVDIRNALPEPRGRFDYRDELMRIIACLTHPVPAERGFRDGSTPPALALTRVISRLDAMANQARVRAEATVR